MLCMMQVIHADPSESLEWKQKTTKLNLMKQTFAKDPSVWYTFESSLSARSGS